MAFGWSFGESPRSQSQKARGLGLRSPLVLAKISHDMRQDYDELLHQPLPEALQEAVQQLPKKPTLKPVENAVPLREPKAILSDRQTGGMTDIASALQST